VEANKDRIDAFLGHPGVAVA